MYQPDNEFQVKFHPPSGNMLSLRQPDRRSANIGGGLFRSVYIEMAIFLHIAGS